MIRGLWGKFFPPDQDPETPKIDATHHHGLINFGNTCYCNSVLQALYFCEPFRERVLEYRKQSKKTDGSLIWCLADLFNQLAAKKKRQPIKPTKFVHMLKKENDAFDNVLQHDAQEFLNFLLNHIGDTLRDEIVRNQKVSQTQSDTHQHNSPCDFQETWVHELFEGVMTNVTRCLRCESVNQKDERFLDLSVDIEPNTSINHCLKSFSATETLKGEHKYYCEVCCSKQEAHKSLEIRSFPKVLALHLKRFRFEDGVRSHMTKLSYRVVFSRQLRIPSSKYSKDDGSTILYELNAVVVHCGKEINRGHYITLVRAHPSHDQWLVFDDEEVDFLPQAELEAFFGLTESSAGRGNLESAYILFYERVNEEERAKKESKQMSHLGDYTSAKSAKEGKKGKKHQHTSE